MNYEKIILRKLNKLTPRLCDKWDRNTAPRTDIKSSEETYALPLSKKTRRVRTKSRTSVHLTQ